MASPEFFCTHTFIFSVRFPTVPARVPSSQIEALSKVTALELLRSNSSEGRLKCNQQDVRAFAINDNSAGHGSISSPDSRSHYMKLPCSKLINSRAYRQTDDTVLSACYLCPSKVSCHAWLSFNIPIRLKLYWN